MSEPHPSRSSWTLSGGRCLRTGSRPLVMGILNLTPDSFSDGGLWSTRDAALAHARTMITEGAEILDLGAESTRPGGGVYGSGATEVSPAEEIDRLLPVLEALREETDLPLSVDTRKSEVARVALEAGADLINDVGGLRDPELAAVAARAGCPLILMHSRGELGDMQRSIRFEDVVEEVVRELLELCQRALRAGVEQKALIVDPGIGFGKNRPQNLTLIRALGELRRATDCPVLLGASRKSFISATVPPDGRLGGSLAAAAWAAAQRTEFLRVHDVGATRQFLDTWDAIHSTGSGASSPALPPAPR